MLIPMQELVEKYGVRPHGVLHLGANIAEEAADYERAGVSKVIWVECHSGSFRLLSQAIQGKPGHTAFQVAVSDRDDQTVDFHRTTNVMSSSLLPLHKHLEKHPEVRSDGTEKVRTITVDTLLKRNAVKASEFEFVNLDLQGAELMAFRGMTEYLRTCRWVYTEVNTEELYRGCALFPEIDAFLSRAGFKLVDRRMWSDFHAWGDAFYSR